MNSLVRAVVRLCTATGTPRRAMLRARLAPITASPVTPIRLCPVDSVIALPRGWLRASFPRSAPPVKHVARSGRPWEKERMSYVKRLDEIGRGDIELAGGKGANLGELTRAGMPVPPGFVLSTAAYRAFVSENGLDGRILALAQLPPDAGSSGYEAAAERIRALLTSAEIPDPLAVEIAEAR